MSPEEASEVIEQQVSAETSVRNEMDYHLYPDSRVLAAAHRVIAQQPDTADSADSADSGGDGGDGEDGAAASPGDAVSPFGDRVWLETAGGVRIPDPSPDQQWPTAGFPTSAQGAADESTDPARAAAQEPVALPWLHVPEHQHAVDTQARDLAYASTDTAAAEAQRIEDAYTRAMTHENTPLVMTDEDGGFTYSDEYPEGNESYRLERQLAEHLRDHPELREHSTWGTRYAGLEEALDQFATEQRQWSDQHGDNPATEPGLPDTARQAAQDADHRQASGGPAGNAPMRFGFVAPAHAQGPDSAEPDSSLDTALDSARAAMHRLNTRTAGVSRDDHEPPASPTDHTVVAAREDYATDM